MTRPLRASKGERAVLYKYIEGIMGRDLNRDTELPYLSELLKMVIKSQLVECELLNKGLRGKFKREQDRFATEKGLLMEEIVRLKE